MSGEHPSGEHKPAESDPFETAAGHVGAAPPPDWGGTPSAAPAPGREAPPPFTPFPSGAPGPGNAAWTPGPPPGSGAGGASGPAGGMSGPGGAPGAPWSAEPPAAAYNPYGAPASYRNRRSWGGSASGASVTYPGYGRNGGNWGPRPLPSPLRNLWWLFGGILTLGLIYPVPAVICWRRAYRFRAPQLRRPPALEWLIWALTFTLLSAGVYIGWGFAIAAGSSDNSSGGPFSYTPPKVTDLAFGSTATFKDEVAPPNDTGKAQISMTLSDLVHHPRTKVKDVNVTAQVRVCATSTSIDPLMAALSPTISPVGEPAGSSGLLPSPDYTLPDDFYHQLAPHRCVTGTIGYRFPTGATVNAFYLDGNAGDIVVWKLTHAQSGGPV